MNQVSIMFGWSVALKPKRPANNFRVMYPTFLWFALDIYLEIVKKTF